MSKESTPSLAGRVRRARRIGTTFGRIYLGIKAQQFIQRRLDPPDMDQRWARFHLGAARQIHRSAVDLRGMILKGCQFMGSRADVLPPEYVEVLSQLQDRVPAKPFPVVRQIVEEELGSRLEEIFAEFDPHPLAAASLAQVHRARLHPRPGESTGEPVAVKVQYPEIASLVRSDLSNLRALFRAVGVVERDFDLMPVVDELNEYVPRELDFENEAPGACW
jgi:predicted unusual protein kinase regulating ubiquinone biosynthesis (AarF/ABC1/UbiB family)